MITFGKKQKKYMTNYIVNKTTTEVFVAIADSMVEATKTIEQGNGVPVNITISYGARPQTPPNIPLPLQPIMASPVASPKS